MLQADIQLNLTIAAEKFNSNSKIIFFWVVFEAQLTYGFLKKFFLEIQSSSK